MAFDMDSNRKTGIFNGTIFKRKRRRTGTDFLFLLGTVPFGIFSDKRDSVPVMESVCKL